MVFPSCKWAERDDKVILTVDVRNVPKDAKIALKDNVVSVEYGEIKADIKLFKDAVTEESSWAITPRGIVFQLKKKENGYWNRIVEGKAPAWIKVDWDLWRDEDESEDEEKDDPMAGMDFSNMDFSRFGKMEGSDDINDDDMPPLEDEAPEEKKDGCCCCHDDCCKNEEEKKEEKDCCCCHDDCCKNEEEKKEEKDCCCCHDDCCKKD